MTPHDDVIKCKHFPRNWPFVRGIHRSPVNSPHKGHWRGALMFSFICVWINDWVNNCEAGDLRRYRAHYDVIVMHHGDTQTLVFHEGGFQMPLNCMSVGLVSYSWNENAILKFYSLTALEIVILTTSSLASDENENNCVGFYWFKLWTSVPAGVKGRDR